MGFCAISYELERFTGDICVHVWCLGDKGERGTCPLSGSLLQVQWDYTTNKVTAWRAPGQMEDAFQHQTHFRNFLGSRLELGFMGAELHGTPHSRHHPGGAAGRKASPPSKLPSCPQGNEESLGANQKEARPCMLSQMQAGASRPESYRSHAGCHEGCVSPRLPCWPPLLQTLSLSL